MRTAKEYLRFTTEICSPVKEILSAADLIRETSHFHGGTFTNKSIGTSANGFKIDLISVGPTSASNILFYGFPDPGEAVGGTGILFLLKAIQAGHPFLRDLTIRWNFIPCLNFDDQPNHGIGHSSIQKTEAQEVDWLAHKPRPETTALLQLSEELKPIFIFPLHDEWHCHEPIPCYFPVSRPLPESICSGIREILEFSGFEISAETQHPTMGTGFFDMMQIPDIANSTFLRFSQYGTVFICEMPDNPSIGPSATVAAQLAAGLFVLESCLTGANCKNS